MINPFRSEAEAYRFLLVTVGYFAAIAIAALAVDKWAGLAVFALLTQAGLTYLVRGPVPDGGVERGTDDQHVLVVALRPAANLLP